MALPHAHPDDVIDLLAPALPDGSEVSRSLLRTPHLQLIRLALGAGQQMPMHQVPGEITVQCLRGAVSLILPGTTCRLDAGHLVALAGGEPHAVQALVDALLLVTVLHPQGTA